MTEQSSTAAGESAETTSTTTTAEPQIEQQPAPSPRLLSVLEGLDLPKEVRESVAPEPEEVIEPEPEGENGEIAPEGEPEPEVTPQGEVEKPVKKEWDPEAKARVAEETRKRKERTIERDAEKKRADIAEAKVAQLEERVKTTVPVRVNPTAQDPLSDVTNPTELAASKAQWEELLEFSETHRDGAEGIVVGKDANGNDILKDYSAEELTAMRLKAGRILRENIPHKEVYLKDRQQLDTAAREIYPEMFDESKPEHQLYQNLVQQMPGLQQFSDADLWIGRAIRGFKAEAIEAGRRARGEKAPSKTVAALTRKQPPLAPAAVKTGASRAPAANRGDDVDVSKAKERVQTGGGDEALNDLVSAARSKQAPKRGGREPALV
jgi:hypothetical protein